MESPLIVDEVTDRRLVFRWKVLGCIYFIVVDICTDIMKKYADYVIDSDGNPLEYVATDVAFAAQIIFPRTKLTPASGASYRYH